MDAAGGRARFADEAFRDRRPRSRHVFVTAEVSSGGSRRRRHVVEDLGFGFPRGLSSGFELSLLGRGDGFRLLADLIARNRLVFIGESGRRDASPFADVKMIVRAIRGCVELYNARMADQVKEGFWAW